MHIRFLAFSSARRMYPIESVLLLPIIGSANGFILPFRMLYVSASDGGHICCARSLLRDHGWPTAGRGITTDAVILEDQHRPRSLWEVAGTKARQRSRDNLEIGSCIRTVV